MRVLTHNFLMCSVRGCTSNNYPLTIKPTQVDTVESEFNADFMRNMIPKLEWNALVSSCRDVRFHTPQSIPTHCHTYFICLSHRYSWE
jgi:multifunctional methyltransferase subunit TRM112